MTFTLLMTCAINAHSIRTNPHYYYVKIEDKCRNMTFYSEIVYGEFIEDSLISLTQLNWNGAFSSKCVQNEAVFTVHKFDSKIEVETTRKKDIDDSLENDKSPITFFLEYD
jgi:hypothetical protein